jgi:O-antigen ligase
MEDTYSMIAYTAMLFCGITIIIFFVIKPFQTILFYFASSTTLQLLNDARIALPLSKAHITFGGIMLSIILLFGAYAIIINKKRSLREIRDINILFLIFICWMFGSTLYNAGSLDLLSAVKELGRITGVYILFLIGYKYASSAQDIRKFHIALFSSLIVPIAVSLYQLAFGTQYLQLEKYNRIYGTFGIPNMWGMYLILPLFVLLVLSLRHGIDIKKIFLWGLFLFLCVILIFTYTRASWFAFLVGCLYIAWERYRRLLPYLMGFSLILLSIFSLEGLRLGSTGSSGRIGLWTALFPAGLASPIIGNGITSMAHISKKLFGLTNQGQNQYLLYWIEGGLVGTAIFSLLVISVFKKMKASYRNIKENYLQDIMLAQCAFLLGMISIALFESNAIFQSWVWLSSGIMLGVAVSSMKATENSISPTSKCIPPK